MKVAGTRLEPIVVAARQRADERRRRQPLVRLRSLVREDRSRRQRTRTALSGDGLAFIAECKRKSPSAGSLIEARPGQALARDESRDWYERAAEYARGGAAMLSVLTDIDHFGGTLDDLRTVEHVRLPRLRKDFLLDEGMVLESAIYGADAVLLLPAILEDTELRELRACAGEAGLAVLIEAHDEVELELAVALEPELVGVNARDLRTFEVDLATVERLLPLVPHDRSGGGSLKVAESGVDSVEALRRVRAAGADAVLVGSALMRAPDPAAQLAEWKQALDD